MDFLNQRQKNILSRKKIYIFGAGVLGQEYFHVLEKFGVFAGYIDNSKEKQGTLCHGSRVISFASYMKDAILDMSVIVVCVSQKNRNAIANQLMDSGLQENYDFWDYEKFFNEVFPLFLMYQFHVFYVPVTQISLTERCTLHCRKCAHACNLVPPNANDLPLPVAKEGADYFFKFVDYVDEFVLIGGEPFLYKSIAEIIEYIGLRYRKKINIFSITTNGTVLPQDSLLTLCNKYHVLIRISNYSQSIPKIVKQYERWRDKALDFSVECKIGEAASWMDYGFDYVNRKASADELIKVFDACRTPCHEIRGSKFYYCVMARSVAENMHKGIGEEDCLDLKELNDECGRMMFFEYTMGYSDKGYLDMCKFCHGAEAKSHLIPVAEQVEDKHD